MKVIEEAIKCQKDLIEHYRKQLEKAKECDAAKIRERINNLNIAIEALWRLNPKPRTDKGKCPVCLNKVENGQFYCSICGECLLNDENGGDVD